MTTANPLFYLPDWEMYKTREPWGKAFSYSLFGHSVLLLLLILFAVQKKSELQTILTEVKFIEQPVAAPITTAEAVTKEIPGEGKGEGEKAQRRGEGGKALEGHGRGVVSGASKSIGFGEGEGSSSPQANGEGEANGVGKGLAPIAGPISGTVVSIDQLGLLGRKKGTLAPGGGTGTGSGAHSALPSIGYGKGEGGGQRITLNTKDVNALRGEESSIGSPLVSEQVVSNSIGGSGRGLAGNDIGSRRKAKYEDLKANPSDEDKWGKNKGPFSMEGPLKYRKILKMELPVYPKWAEEKAIETSVSVRLWVNFRGIVLDNMYLEKTSGYSELDHLAMDALQKFKFVPLPDGQGQDDEWGVATFRFELKKDKGR